MTGLLRVLVAAALLRHGAEGVLAGDAPQLVGDYFRYMQIRVLVAVTCSPQDAVRLMKATRMWVSPVAPDAGLEAARLRTSPLRPGVFVDGDCSVGQRALDAGSAQGLLAGNASWLVWSSSPPPPSLALRVDSELTWATPEQQPGAVSLSDVYQVAPGWPLTVSCAGRWDQAQGLRYLLARFKSSNRDLQGLRLAAAIVHFWKQRGSDECVMLKINIIPTDNLELRLVSRESKHLDAISKFNYAVFLNLQEMFNFSIRLVATRSWGYLRPDGSFDGTVGMLARGDVNLSVSSCIIRAARLNAVDYAGPSWKFRSWIMFRQPPSLGVHATLLLPFRFEVWLFSALLFAFIMAALRLQHWAEHRYRRDAKTEDSWSAVIVFAVGSISQQGTELDSGWASWRVIILFTSLMAFMLDTYYSAAVVYSLLLPAPKTIRSKRDLIDSPLGVGMEDIAYTRDYFERTTDPLGKELYHKKVFPPGRNAPAYYSLQEGVERMRTQLFAFHAEEVSMFPLIEGSFGARDICSLSGIPLFKHGMTEHPVGKGSPFKEMITYGLRASWERGHLKRHEQVWRPRSLACSDSGESANVGLDELSPAFLLLLGGALAATAVLLLERRRLRRGSKRF